MLTTNNSYQYCMCCLVDCVTDQHVSSGEMARGWINAHLQLASVLLTTIVTFTAILGENSVLVAWLENVF